MGIDFSDEVERSICPFQRIDLQVAKKTKKAAYSLM
jgi:hypothetical protein